MKEGWTKEGCPSNAILLRDSGLMFFLVFLETFLSFPTKLSFQMQTFDKKEQFTLQVSEEDQCVLVPEVGKWRWC